MIPRKTLGPTVRTLSDRSRVRQGASTQGAIPRRTGLGSPVGGTAHPDGLEVVIERGERALGSVGFDAGPDGRASATRCRPEPSGLVVSIFVHRCM